jgi:C_GCAxxG_C_C family probable redox protein
MRRNNMDSNEKQASEYFAEGFNCAQSVLASHAQQFGLDSETALKVSAAFGAGMGRQGEVCGAVTGALMALGLKHGAISADDKEAKEKTYGLVHQFLDEFAQKNGSFLCRELLGYRIDNPEERKKAQEAGVFSTVCPKLVREASEMLDEMLAKEIP